MLNVDPPKATLLALITVGMLFVALKVVFASDKTTTNYAFLTKTLVAIFAAVLIAGAAFNIGAVTAAMGNVLNWVLGLFA